VRWYSKRVEMRPVNVEVAVANYRKALVLSREAKRRRSGTCADCGEPTRYSGHGRSASARCIPCSNRRSADKQRGTGWAADAVRAALADGRELHYMELVQALGRSNGYTASTVNRLLRHGIIVRVRRGVYRLAEE
jgi:hypothetical protein